MNQQDAILRSILANPEDDGPRLAYADWLAEQEGEAGRAQAEFIRAQCALARLPEGDRQRPKLAKEVRRLLRAYAADWTFPLREAKFGKKWGFRRGLLEEGQIKATKFVRNAKRLFELVPTLRALRFPEASNEVTALAKCSHLARLTEVDLCGMCECGRCPIDRELRELFASPHVANLTTLKLGRDRIDAEGARHLAKSPHMAKLTTLDLAFNDLGPDGVKALAASKQLKHLTTLDLSGNDLGTAGTQALADASLFAGLITLRLSDNGIGPVGGRALAGSPHLGNLRSLDLSDNRLGDSGAKALADSPLTERLQSLDLSNNKIDEETAKSLSKRFGKRVKV